MSSPHERDVCAETAVDAGAVHADENPEWNRGPCAVLGHAIKAYLEQKISQRMVEATFCERPSNEGVGHTLLADWFESFLKTAIVCGD